MKTRLSQFEVRKHSFRFLKSFNKSTCSVFVYRHKLGRLLFRLFHRKCYKKLLVWSYYLCGKWIKNARWALTSILRKASVEIVPMGGSLTLIYHLVFSTLRTETTKCCSIAYQINTPLNLKFGWIRDSSRRNTFLAAGLFFSPAFYTFYVFVFLFLFFEILIS